MSAPHMKLEAAAAASGVDTEGQGGPRVKRLKGLQPLQYGSSQLSAQLTAAGRKQQQEEKHTQQSAAEKLVLESSSTRPQDQDSSAADVVAAASAAGGACRGVHTKGSSSRLQHTTAAGQAASSQPRAIQAPAHGACDEAFYSPGNSPTHASTAGCTSSSSAAAAAGTGAATVAEGAGESAMAVGQTSAPVQAGRLSAAAAAAAGVGTSELADGADIAAVAMTAAANAAAAAAKCAEFALASRLDEQRRPSLQQQSAPNEPQHLLQGQMHLCEQQQQQQQQMLDVVQQEQQMDWPTNDSPLQAPGFAIEQQQQPQHQQEPPVDLNEQYKVWPDLDPRTDGSTETEFDLVPLSACSAGVQPMLQMLINATQKPEPKLKSEPSSGRGRGGKGRGRGAGRSTSKGRGRGRPKKHADSDATAAAASRLAGKMGAAAAAGGGSSSMFDSWESGGTDPDIPPCCDYSYAQEDDWQYGQQQYDELYGQYDELQYGEQHDFDAFGFDGSSSATAAAAAAAAAAAGSVDDEDAWYSAAEAAGTTFTWREAPRGRFYTVEYEKSKGTKTTSSGIEAVMTPAKVVTRRSFRDELWNMSKRTRVVPVTDPCHPCIHNPVRPAVMPIGRQLKLEANRDLPAGCLLGLYWGKVLTMQEDQLQNSLDLTCSYGLQHAYNMTAHSITAADLIGPDSLRLEVMVVGDSQRCRLCLVNDVSSWAQVMREQGWGPCPQEASGNCNCEDYKIDTEELKAASINVKWRHFMYRALNGDYIPAIAAYTSKEVAEGRELLTTYEENNNGFFDAMTTNIRQHCYVQTLAAKSEAPVQALEKILSLISSQPDGSSGSSGGSNSSSSSILQHIKQLATSGLASARQQERNLLMLLSEARALQLGEQVPAEVAEARRRAVAAYLQQQQQQH